MPLYVGTSQKRRRVKLLTAGDTVYKLSNLLGGTVNLEAILNDTFNLRNHTLTWEQTKGEEVQLSSIASLTTSYVIADNTDKTFEFHLDKGLNTQQTKRVDIYYTPTSVTPAEKGKAYKHGHNDKTVPNLRFDFGVEHPEFVLGFNPDVDIKAGTGIVFDETPYPFLQGKALRLRLYGEVNGWTHTPSTLLRTVDAVEGKVVNFLFVENGSYVVEVDYIHNNNSGVVTYKSEPIFAFDIGENEDLVRGVNELIPSSVGTAFKLNSVFRQVFEKTVVNEPLMLGGGGQYNLNYLARRSNRKTENDTYIESSGGTLFKIISVTRLNPSQIGNT